MGMIPLPGEYAAYKWFPKEADSWDFDENEPIIVGDLEIVLSDASQFDVPTTRHREASATTGTTRPLPNRKRSPSKPAAKSAPKPSNGRPSGKSVKNQPRKPGGASRAAQPGNEPGNEPVAAQNTGNRSNSRRRRSRRPNSTLKAV